MASITYTILSGCYREEEGEEGGKGGREGGREGGGKGAVKGGKMGIRKKGVEEEKKEAEINTQTSKHNQLYGVMHSGQLLL